MTKGEGIMTTEELRGRYDVASLIEEGRTKLAAKRKAEAEKKEAEEAAEQHARQESWAEVLAAASEAAPQLFAFVEPTIPENWRRGYGDEFPTDATVLFNPPGCHQIRACFQKLKGEWVQRPVFYRSHHRGLWQIGWPEYSQGSDGPYVGYGEPTFTDDLAMALALAEESAAQEQKVRAQVEESERRRAELAKARADRHAEPTLEERLLAALREFVQQEIPEPVE